MGAVQRHANLRLRANILRAVRTFFEQSDFLEIDTPQRIPIPIPEAHIDIVSSESWVLHPSPELCMKLLLAEGFERIFQICHCWRHGERGALHLPEFTMLEWYRTNADYTNLMDDCTTLVRTVTEAVGLQGGISRHGHTIRVDGPWERLTVAEAFQRFGGMSVEEALARDLFDEVMVCAIEPQLGRDTPTFLIDYPAERGSLARRKPGNKAVAERFELYIGGIELANAFSELVDSSEQRARFIEEQHYRRTMGKPVYPLPEKLLATLPHLPPSAGIALGFDRLVMLLADVATIDSIVAFTPEAL